MSDDYTPELTRITLYVGDQRPVGVTIPQITTFSAVSGVLIGPDDSDKTASYCTGSPAYSGNALTSATIGVGSGTIVAGEYRYYITGTYDGGQVATWYWPVSAVAKLGGL